MAIATLYHKNRFFISVKWTFFISVSIRQSVEAASFMIHVTGLGSLHDLLMSLFSDMIQISLLLHRDPSLID